MSSPQAVPGVDLAVIQVVLFSGVEHKLSLVGAVFLKQKNKKGEETDREVQRKAACLQDTEPGTRPAERNPASFALVPPQEAHNDTHTEEDSQEFPNNHYDSFKALIQFF